MTERAQTRLPLLVLALALAVVFHRLLLGEVFFWGLPSLQFYPWREYAFEVLRAGQLPLWNPYNGAGAPLLANYQSALLYPLNWLGYVLPLAWTMSLTAVLHLFVAGWGMWTFTGRLGLLSLGRGISALAFGLTGYLVARLGTYPIVSAAAWIPWILWAALCILQQGDRRYVAWLALFAGLQLLAGHAQTTWYGLLLAVLFALWWSLTHRPVYWQRLALVAGALFLGAGTAALQLFPTAELLLQSQRSDGVNYEKAMNFSYSLPRALNLLSPNVFGSPADGTYITEKGAFFEDAVYIGLIPLVSALAASAVWLATRLRKRERPAVFVTVPFWLVIVIVAFVLALGQHSPIFPFLYRNIPTFDLFQAPVRWHIWTVFGLSLLAGIGVSVWGHGHWLFFGTRLATAACIGAVLLAGIAPRFLPPDVSDNQGVQVIVRAVIVTGILGAVAGVLTLTQPEDRHSRYYPAWMLAVLLVVAADLSYAAWGLNPTISADFYQRRETMVVNNGRAYWPSKTEEAVMYDRFLRFDDYRVATQDWQAYRASHLPNLNLIDRRPLLNNFDPFLIGDFNRYLGLIEKHPDRRDQLLQAANTNVVYNTAGQPEVVPQPNVAAWFIPTVCWHPDETSLQAGLLNPTWQPLMQAHLVGSGDCPVSPYASTSNTILDVQAHSNRVDVRVSAPADGLLVIANTDYPGWQATVDGQPRPVLRANLAFQAVEVPAGAREVRLDYRPAWLLPGALVSVVSLLVLLVLFRSRNPGLSPENDISQ